MIKDIDFYKGSGYIIFNKTKGVQMKSKKGFEKFLDALTILLCNYATVQGFLAVFYHTERDLIGAISVIVCLFYISTLYED